MKSNLLLPLFLFLVLLISSCVKWENPPTEGLILYLPFEGDLRDLSTNENDGIDYTSDNFVCGKWGKALDFNGTSDYIQLSETINAEYGLSFSFWIKSRGPNGLENNGAIVSKYNMTAHRRSFMIFSFGAIETRNDNRLSANFYKFGNLTSINDHVKSYMDTEDLTKYENPALWKLISRKRLELNKWTHCVINVTPEEIQAWINGEICVTKTREHDLYYNSQDEPVYIGNIPAGGEGSNNHFNGILDELRIYNRELSEREIQILYRNK